jgi:hypothetical protein
MKKILVLSLLSSVCILANDNSLVDCVAKGVVVVSSKRTETTCDEKTCENCECTKKNDCPAQNCPCPDTIEEKKECVQPAQDVVVRSCSTQDESDEVTDNPKKCPCKKICPEVGCDENDCKASEVVDSDCPCEKKK